MTHLRTPLRLVVPALIIAATVGMAGCAAPGAGDPGTGDGPTAEETTGSDGGSPTAEPWAECPGIVERLNANEDDPTVYEQIAAAEFEVPEVGADVLAGACVIRVSVTDEPITWAILPGDSALADDVAAALSTAGFPPVGLGIHGNQASGRAVLVQSFETGADLDAYLVYSKAFAAIEEPIVYLGTFVQS